MHKFPGAKILYPRIIIILHLKVTYKFKIHKTKNIEIIHVINKLKLDKYNYQMS